MSDDWDGRFEGIHARWVTAAKASDRRYEDSSLEDRLWCSSNNGEMEKTERKRIVFFCSTRGGAGNFVSCRQYVYLEYRCGELEVGEPCLIVPLR